jgi:hypothetical protein
VRIVRALFEEFVKMLTVSRWLLGCLACFALAVPVVAAPVPASTDKKAESPAEKINKALDQTSDFSFDNANLSQALQDLSKDKFNVVIDRITFINTWGFEPNSPQAPVSVNLKNVKTRTALRSVLSQYNLGYAIVGDTMIVTTEEMAIQKQLRQRVSVDLDKTTAADAFKRLSKETGTNLLLDSRVAKESQTAVTLQLDDVPLDTAVKLISQMAGLKTVKIGNVLFITTKAMAEEMRQDPDLQGGEAISVSEQELMNRDLQMLLRQQGIAPQLFLNPPPIR